jgi:TolB-like protein/Flp pilus assembly protein TadD/class 3 adenylate cyclase
MAVEASSDFDLEIAHVLFMDIVGYSKGLIDQQRDLLNELNKIVRETQQFKSAEATGKLIRLPTGDGMALAFFTNPEAPLKCAIEISEAVGQALPLAGKKPRQVGTLALHLRMGIHSGPVEQVADVNDRKNVAGAGINMAQRVMDCGDAGHILLSKRIADDLAQYARWRPQLHELGEIEVKHGVKVEIVNFYANGIGNAAVPRKVALTREEEATASKSERARSRTKRRAIAIAFLLAALLIIALLIFSYRAARKSAIAIKPSIADLLPEKSIAVLPFENLSAEKDDAFFADGIQDDVLTTLGKVKELTVIARASVMNYRGAAMGGKLREIGKTLGVSHVLEGSVRRSANRVVVNVQLIDTRDDHQVWSERYDRTLTDSIGLQGELATEIAHALRARLDPEEKARLATRPTNNPEAYVLYLKARDKERTSASLEDASAIDGIYDQAITLDPKFAVAMARQSIWNSGMYFEARSQERKSKAHALAMEALRVAPDLPEAHIALGEWFRMAERNYDAALKELSIAAQTIPNDPEILEVMGVLYRRQGRWREALATFRRAQELDPRVPHHEVAQTAAMLRDWHTATVEFRHALELAPDDVHIKQSLASALMIGEGDFAAAKAILETIPYPRWDASGNPVWDDMVPRWELYMLERDFAGAEKLLVDFPLQDFPPPHNGLKTFFFARIALAKGDLATARALFEKARPAYEAAVQDHPGEPRFLARLGLLYAYLGRNEDALRESRRAVDLVAENDAIDRPRYSGNLALVYALTGETDEAITLVEQLLTTPTGPEDQITITELRSWRWDSLRSNPPFQKILAGPEPKTIY